MNKFLFIALAALLFFGCSKKNSTNPSNNISITGKWNVKIDTVRQYVNGQLQFTVPSGDTGSPYFQFNADGSGSIAANIADAAGKAIFTYTVTNNVITFNYPKQTLDGYEQDAYVQTAAVKQLTSDKLTIYFDDKTIENGVVVNEVTETAYMTK